MAVAPPRRPGADREAEYSGQANAPVGFPFWPPRHMVHTRPDVWTVYFVGNSLIGLTRSSSSYRHALKHLLYKTINRPHDCASNVEKSVW